MGSDFLQYLDVLRNFKRLAEGEHEFPVIFVVYWLMVRVRSHLHNVSDSFIH